MDNKEKIVQNILKHLDGLSYKEYIEVLQAVNSAIISSLKIVPNTVKKKSSSNTEKDFWYGLFAKALSVYTEPLPKFGKDTLD